MVPDKPTGLGLLPVVRVSYTTAAVRATGTGAS